MHICVRINSVMLYNNTSYLKLLTIVIPSKDFVVVTALLHESDIR